jgi:hypothetical protein
LIEFRTALYSPDMPGRALFLPSREAGRNRRQVLRLPPFIAAGKTAEINGAGSGGFCVSAGIFFLFPDKL